MYVKWRRMTLNSNSTPTTDNNYESEMEKTETIYFV